MQQQQQQQQQQQPMKSSDSSDGSTACFGSPVSTKPSWADLCEDSDCHEWEEEARTNSTESRQEDGTPYWKGAAELQDTAWPRSEQHPDQQVPGSATRAKRAGRSGQQRSTPKGSWSNNGHANKGARRAPTGAKPAYPVMGYSMPPHGCSPMDSYSVVLEGMPLNLCNDACLDAMLHQAGLQGAIVKVEIQTGAAVITLSHWQAAMQCYNHFATSRWSSGSLKVTMSLPKGSQGSTGDSLDRSDSATEAVVPCAAGFEVSPMLQQLQQQQQQAGAWSKSPKGFNTVSKSHASGNFFKQENSASQYFSRNHLDGPEYYASNDYSKDYAVVGTKVPYPVADMGHFHAHTQASSFRQPRVPCV